MYLGLKQSEAVQYYESLALIAGEVFGDGKKKKTQVSAEHRKVASTKAEIIAGMQEMFG